MPLQPGLSARVHLVISGDDLATAIGSGVVEVLATPRVVALCEQATVLATEGHLEPGEATVGTRIEIDHTRASIIGASVTARAELQSVDGRRLVFAVTATDGGNTIATGLIDRTVVDRRKFTDRLSSRPDLGDTGGSGSDRELPGVTPHEAGHVDTTGDTSEPPLSDQKP